MDTRDPPGTNRLAGLILVAASDQKDDPGMAIERLSFKSKTRRSVISWDEHNVLQSS
jgi:hypothetical protein